MMLRLSTKGQYGVRAMFEIARGYRRNPVTIKEISERQDVSVAYLEQILNKLRKAGLVRSVKGPGGGYLLAKEPGQITIAEILKELEGPVAITSCLDPEEGCSRVEGCVTHLLWRSLGILCRQHLHNMNASFTNHEICFFRPVQYRIGQTAWTARSLSRCMISSACICRALSCSRKKGIRNFSYS